MKKVYLVLSITFISFAGCKKGDLNLFSIEDDKSLGQQTVNQILADPQQFPVLSRTQYPQQYAYLDNMRNEILNSG